jgi:DNA replication and repair protein RecF
MRVDRLILRNYRNYENLDLELINNVNIFVGENAQGKTNILEAVYMGAVGRSHRTAEDDDLVGWEKDSASVDLFFTRHGVANKLGFRLIKGRNKEILFNDYAIKPREVIGSLNAVLFSPEDLWLIKGAPAMRRRFLDIEIAQASPLYYRNLLQYNRVVNQRNHLLKKVVDKNKLPELLSSWEEQLVKLAVFIVNKRLEAVKKLGMLANLMHRRLTGSRENLAMAYYLAGSDGDIPADLHGWYCEKLDLWREMDIARGSTSVGPHRDDVILRVNARELRSFGSQGQQRTGILALKLAELEFLKSETGEYPVLLLDDVMSELDGLRREQLITFIRDRIQTFITATDATIFPAVRAGRSFRVQNGTVTG